MKYMKEDPKRDRMNLPSPRVPLGICSSCAGLNLSSEVPDLLNPSFLLLKGPLHSYPKMPFLSFKLLLVFIKVDILPRVRLKIVSIL